MRSDDNRRIRRVLCAEHHRYVQASLGEHLEKNGYDVVMCPEAVKLLDYISEFSPSVILLDTSMPGIEGSNLLNEVLDKHTDIPVIVIAAEGSIEEAVDLMRLGVYDYLPAPPDFTRLDIGIRNAVEFNGLANRYSALESMQERYQFDDIIGVSTEMQKIFKLIRNVARTDANVFIIGESGTGKELIARSIHLNSGRAAKPLVIVNCAAIPAELIESELFGHEKGAFTGAYKRKIGSFQAADGGTIFLDEICEMPVGLQAKLLRFIQERKFLRVGGSRNIRVDVRILAATNRDPVVEVNEGRFREDLYYRLLVVPIEVPALRDRREDIPILAMHFLERFANEHGRNFFEFSPEAMKMLINYSWHGNVRELENVIENIVILHDGKVVYPKHLPEQIRNHVPEHAGAEKVEVVVKHLIPEEDKIIPFKEMEKMVIENALKACDGNVVKAARKLRIGQATVYRKIKAYGIGA